MLPRPEPGQKKKVSSRAHKKGEGAKIPGNCDTGGRGGGGQLQCVSLAMSKLPARWGKGNTLNTVERKKKEQRFRLLCGRGGSKILPFRYTQSRKKSNLLLRGKAKKTVTVQRLFAVQNSKGGGARCIRARESDSVERFWRDGRVGKVPSSQEAAWEEIEKPQATSHRVPTKGKLSPFVQENHVECEDADQGDDVFFFFVGRAPSGRPDLGRKGGGTGSPFASAEGTAGQAAQGTRKKKKRSCTSPPGTERDYAPFPHIKDSDCCGILT